LFQTSLILWIISPLLPINNRENLRTKQEKGRKESAQHHNNINFWSPLQQLTQFSFLRACLLLLLLLLLYLLCVYYPFILASFSYSLFSKCVLNGERVLLSFSKMGMHLYQPRLHFLSFISVGNNSSNKKTRRRKIRSEKETELKYCYVFFFVVIAAAGDGGPHRQYKKKKKILHSSLIS